MDKDQIRALEPKYTGNTRHLTEGEAYAIRNDPNFETDDEDLLEKIPPVLFAGGSTRLNSPS